LFKEGASQGDRSVLDAVIEDASGLRRRIARADRRKLDEYLAADMRLMCDLLVLAFQTDTTRIVTLKLNNNHSSLRFSNLGVDHMIHHLLSHADTDDWLKVNRFFVEQLAYVARRLDAIDEGGPDGARQFDALVLLAPAGTCGRRGNLTRRSSLGTVLGGDCRRFLGLFSGAYGLSSCGNELKMGAWVRRPPSRPAISIRSLGNCSRAWLAMQRGARS